VCSYNQTPVPSKTAKDSSINGLVSYPQGCSSHHRTAVQPAARFVTMAVSATRSDAVDALRSIRDLRSGWLPAQFATCGNRRSQLALRETAIDEQTPRILRRGGMARSLRCLRDSHSKELR